MPEAVEPASDVDLRLTLEDNEHRIGPVARFEDDLARSEGDLVADPSQFVEVATVELSEQLRARLTHPSEAAPGRINGFHRTKSLMSAVRQPTDDPSPPLNKVWGDSLPLTHAPHVLSANALKEALSLGARGRTRRGGVWAITMAILCQVTNFTVAAMAVFSAGVGLLAVAAFVWLSMIPRRASAREKTYVLRNSVRRHLKDLAKEGSLWMGAGLAPDFAAKRSDW